MPVPGAAEMRDPDTSGKGGEAPGMGYFSGRVAADHGAVDEDLGLF